MSGSARRAPHTPGARLEVTLDSLRDLARRVEQQQLEPNDWGVIAALVSARVAHAEAHRERLLTKAAAKAALMSEPGSPSLASPAAEPPASEETGEDATGDTESPPPAEDTATSKRERRRARRGHGRAGASAYVAAQHIPHPLADGVLGARCEKCAFGRMTRYRDKLVVRLFGQPLFGTEVHRYAQARCRYCGRIVRASGAPHVEDGIGSDYIRYAPSAAAMLMVMHYFAGAPFKRLEALHAGWGIPFSDANQWRLVNEADDRLLPLYKALERHASQTATSFRIDDTGSMVITLQQQINAELAERRAQRKSVKDVRTGINATGVYWETPAGPVILFYTGRHHAGEIVDQLLRQRSGTRSAVVKCTDGASKNFDHEHGDKVVEASCNAHALLKFRDIREQYPAEYAVAGSIYKRVFDNDDEAKRQKLSPEQRMRYHAEHSLPLMLQLKHMCANALKDRTVEPRSPLWSAVNFVLNQWDRLVRFCTVQSVPLDTNLVEQALIMPVRYKAGSFNYQTQDGAVVGDHAMSLIATARASGVEPVAYLTHCLRRWQDLAKHPDDYLPWAYAARARPLAAVSTPAPADVERPADEGIAAAA